MMFLICCLLGTILCGFMMRRNRSPDASFDLLSASEQIDRIAAAKDALNDCESLQTLCEMSNPEYQPAVTITWSDTESHEMTVFLCGDYSAECLLGMAAREAQEIRNELSRMIMKCNHNMNGV